MANCGLLGGLGLGSEVLRVGQPREAPEGMSECVDEWQLVLCADFSGGGSERSRSDRFHFSCLTSRMPEG